MTNPTPPKRNPRAGGRPKIDWPAAFAHFATDPTRSYGNVAAKFGVSDTAVRKHARPGGDYPEGWEVRRAAMVAKATVRLEERAIRALVERQADTIRVAEILRRRALQVEPTAQNPDALDELDLVEAIRHLPAYAKLEQLFAGEATDRFSVVELQEFVRRLHGELDQAVRSAKTPGELRRMLPEILDRAADRHEVEEPVE